MEFFGFATGSSKTGPAFPYMPESVLNNYPSTLLEHPAVPTSTISFLNLNALETPDAKTVVAALRSWAERSLTLLEKPTVQYVGIGLSVTVCIYGAWRIGRRLNHDIQFKVEGSAPPRDVNIGKLPFMAANSVSSCNAGDEESVLDLNMSQRQLADARAKLEDLRYQLTEMESEKEMLTAEVSMRKKMVTSLQGEIHSERDKRHQAELRMEMMEWENSHLRQLRKDCVAKEGKIDALEASLKEKDAVHNKLFQENVILPKNIAAARAKEYDFLRAQVQKYEMMANMRRNAEKPYRPSRYGSSSSFRGEQEESTSTLETAYQTSEWDVSQASSVLSPSFPVHVFNRAKNLIYSTANRSNCAYRKSADTLEASTVTQENDCGRQKSSFSINADDTQLELPNSGKASRKVRRVCAERKGRPASKDGVQTDGATFENSTAKPKAHSKEKQSTTPADKRGREPFPTLHVVNSEEENSTVLSQIRTFFGGVDPSSSSNCQIVAAPSLTVSPAQLGDVLPSDSLLWEQANNCCRGDGHRDDEEGVDDDVCCASVSDNQSSEFMSASCGSDSSDEDTRTVSLASRNKSSNRARSSRRARSAKRDCLSNSVAPPISSRSSKRNFCESGSFSQPSERKQTNPTIKLQVISPHAASLKTRDESLTPNTDCKNILPGATSALATGVEDQPKISRFGRARQRCRLRKSRSKLTATLTKGKVVQLCEEVHHLETQTSRFPAVTFNKELAVREPDQVTSGDVSRPSPEAVGKNSHDATDSESEKSWIVITPPK